MPNQNLSRDANRSRKRLQRNAVVRLRVRHGSHKRRNSRALSDYSLINASVNPSRYLIKNRLQFIQRNTVRAGDAGQIHFLVEVNRQLTRRILQERFAAAAYDLFEVDRGVIS